MYNQLTFQTLSPTTASRQTVDLSAYVTSGSTGVALYFENTNFGNATVGACHPSQTTIRTQGIKNNSATVAYVGINASRQVDVFLGAGVNLTLIGEFDSEVEFLTQDVDKTPASNLTWTSTAHAETSTAKFAIYNIVKAGDPDVGNTGCRHGDSTDDTQIYATGTNTWAICPLNSSFESDLYKASGYSFFLVGFIDSGADIVEAPVDKSTATTGSWQTVTPTSGTPEYMIVQTRATHTADTNGNRLQLSEDNVGTNLLGKRPVGLHTAIIKTDGSGNIYQNIGSADYDIFVVGNVVASVPDTVTITETDVAFGEVINFTTAGLGTLTSWTLTDSGGNEITLSGTATTATVPAIGDNLNRLLLGSVTLTVGDGTATAQDTVNLTPPTGFSYQTVAAGFSTTPPSSLQGFTGTVAIGDQQLYTTADFNIFDDVGGFEAVASGTYTIYYIDATDGFMESYDLIVGELPPLLTSPSAASITSSGCTPQVTTDKGEGSAYCVLVPDGDIPSIAQVKAGQQSSGSAAISSETVAVSTTGVVNFTTITSAAANTPYELFFVHTDSSSNDSLISTIGFTTLVADTIPDTFSLIDRLNQPTSTFTESNILTVSGVEALTPISITSSDGVQYRVNGGSYTATSGNVNDGDTVQLSVTTSALNSTTSEGILDIGGVTDTWTVTTTSGASSIGKRVLSSDFASLGGTALIWSE